MAALLKENIEQLVSVEDLPSVLYTVKRGKKAHLEQKILLRQVIPPSVVMVAVSVIEKPHTIEKLYPVQLLLI